MTSSRLICGKKDYLGVSFDRLLTHPDGGEHVADGDEQLVVRLQRVHQVLKVVVVLQAVVALHKLKRDIGFQQL